MQIYGELLYQELGRYVADLLDMHKPKLEEEINSSAVKILQEIQAVFQDNEVSENDFLIVEEIINILNRNGISTASCHDF